MSFADMFYEEGDEHLGSTVTSYAKCMYDSILVIIHFVAKSKNKAGDLDLPPMPRQKCNFVGLENQYAYLQESQIFDIEEPHVT